MSSPSLVKLQATTMQPGHHYATLLKKKFIIVFPKEIFTNLYSERFSSLY